jgi:hypothetical protein
MNEKFVWLGTKWRLEASAVRIGDLTGVVSSNTTSWMDAVSTRIGKTSKLSNTTNAGRADVYEKLSVRRKKEVKTVLNDVDITLHNSSNTMIEENLYRYHHWTLIEKYTNQKIH